jgi:Domain of unknown function (DUF4112)
VVKLILKYFRIGDVLDLLMAFEVLWTCRKIQGGLPRNVQAKMIFNIILDLGIGLVPFVGDVADALFRANTRNALALEDHLYERAQGGAGSDIMRPFDAFTV